MSRPLLDEVQIDPAIRGVVAGYRQALVSEVRAAIAAHRVVVVGMAHNPFVRKARRLLQAQQVPFRYIARGSYFSGWHDRLALKMWSGWPTFPMVFVDGRLIGGAQDLQRLIAAGGLAGEAADALSKGDSGRH